MIKRTLAIFLAVFALSACTSAPLQNMHGVAVPEKADGTALTTNEVRASIMQGCVSKGWTPREQKPGLIHCGINVRSHSAEVAIPYSTSDYDIRYLGSTNLDDDGEGRIHRNYNRWVANLSAAIQQELLSRAY